MVGPPTACPDCGWVMPSNALPKHRRARHADPRLALAPTLEEQQRMVELTRRGQSQRAIGELMHWSSSTVSRVLIMWGESRSRRNGHPPRLSADTVLETCQLYGRGYSVAELADLLSMTRSQVRRRLERGGATLRPQGGDTSSSSSAPAEPVSSIESYKAQRKARRASAARRKRSTAREAS
jgi:predicted transcriptional regulator